MTPLLDDKYAPITSEIGFLECSLEHITKAFEEWQTPIQIARENRLARRVVEGNLETKLLALVPLTSHEARRYLFVPTRGQWTAFFDNGWRGTDAFSTVSELCIRAKCRGLRCVFVPHSESGRAGRSRGTVFELYMPDASGCSFLNIRRSVSCVFDNSWAFDAAGEPPLPFERLDQYKNRLVKNRFTPEMLTDYLRHFGVEFLQQSFYEGGGAYLIEKTGPCAAGTKEYSIREARS
ncbi:MAG: hypothetical protein AMXMBFR47_31950 [Planctomycetota bacterium]